MTDAITYKEALERLTETMKNIPAFTDSEEISVGDAIGRVLAKDAVSAEDVPGFSRSTVDGYAVNSADTMGAEGGIPSFFTLIGSAEMGKVNNLSLKTGETVYVPTGGMLPHNADAVAMQEHSETAGGEILLYKPLKPAENTVEPGDDIKKNAVLFAKGTTLNALKLSALCAAGITKVTVYKPVKCAVISTGDELRDYEDNITDGEIRDSNMPFLVSRIGSTFGEVVYKARIEDNWELLIKTLSEATGKAGAIFMSGGSSVGVKDFTAKALEAVGCEIIIKGIALKPGKPTVAAKKDGKLFLGLPGHTMAQAIVFTTLFERALRLTRGIAEPFGTRALAGVNFPSSPGRTTFQPVKLERKDGKLYYYPIFGKSALITVAAAADGYVELEPETEGVYANQDAEVHLF